MTLPILWFIIVAVFWTGFFVLEGFDFGVGALHRVVGRSEAERRDLLISVRRTALRAAFFAEEVFAMDFSFMLSMLV